MEFSSASRPRRSASAPSLLTPEVDQQPPPPAAHDEAPGAPGGEGSAQASPRLVPPEPATGDGSSVSDDDDDLMRTLLARMYGEAAEATRQQPPPGGERLSGLLAAHRPAFVATTGLQAQELDALVDGAVQSAANAYQAGFGLIPFGHANGPKNQDLLETAALPERIEALAEAVRSGRATLAQVFQALDPRGDEPRLFVLCELLDSLLRSRAVDLQSILKAWSDAALPKAAVPFFIEVMARREWTPALRDALVEGVLGCVEALEPSFSGEHRLTLTLIERWLAEPGIPWTAGQVFALQYLYGTAAWGIAAMAQAPDRQWLQPIQERLDLGLASPAEAAEGLKQALKALVDVLASLPQTPRLTVGELQDIADLTGQFAAFAQARGLLSPADARTLRVSVNQARMLVAEATRTPPRLVLEDLPAEAPALEAMAPEALEKLAGDLHSVLRHVQEADLTDMARSPELVVAFTQLVGAVEAGVDIGAVIECVLGKGTPVELLSLLLLELAHTLVRRAGEQDAVFDYRRLLRPLLRTSPDERSVEQLAQRIDKAAGQRTVQLVAALEAMHDHILLLLTTRPALSVLEVLRCHALAIRLGHELLGLGSRAKALSLEERGAVARWCNAIDAHAAPFLRREVPRLMAQAPM